MAYRRDLARPGTLGQSRIRDRRRMAAKPGLACHAEGRGFESLHPLLWINTATEKGPQTRAFRFWEDDKATILHPFLHPSRIYYDGSASDLTARRLPRQAKESRPTGFCFCRGNVSPVAGLLSEFCPFPGGRSRTDESRQRGRMNSHAIQRNGRSRLDRRAGLTDRRSSPNAAARNEGFGHDRSV